jgi:hypothetical protein
MAPALPTAMIGISARPVSQAALNKIHRSPSLRKGGKAHDQRDSRNGICVIDGRSVFRGPTMLTTMTEEDWTICKYSRHRAQGAATKGAMTRNSYQHFTNSWSTT